MVLVRVIFIVRVVVPRALIFIILVGPVLHKIAIEVGHFVGLSPAITSRMVPIAIAVAVVVRLVAILLSAAALVLHVEGRGLPPGIALVITGQLAWLLEGGLLQIQPGQFCVF